MENKELIDKIVSFVANSTENFVADEDAIDPSLAGMKIYEEPLVGFAHAADVPYEPDIPQRCSTEWLHARIEGQIFLDKITDYIQSILEDEGFETICPTASGKLRKITPYISTWSERHTAYAAGLGTFGLSKGLITKKGMAGRFGSVITNAEFVADIRPYSEPFEYCIMCGVCDEMSRWCDR